MDIFQILREAKNPSSPKKTKRNNNLPDDLDVDDNDSPPEDATEGIDDGTSTLDDDQDVNEQNDTKDKDKTSDDTIPDDLDVDDNDSPPEDATEGVDDGTSALDDDESNDNQDNEQPEDTPEEDSNENTDESENNAALLRDSIDLYYNIKQNIDKIDKLSYNNNLINKTNIQVKQNLSKLLEYLYDFITIRFKKNKYIDNLYMYDYFIEAYKINVEILKKISSFGEND